MQNYPIVYAGYNLHNEISRTSDRGDLVARGLSVNHANGHGCHNRVEEGSMLRRALRNMYGTDNGAACLVSDYHWSIHCWDRHRGALRACSNVWERVGANTYQRPDSLVGQFMVSMLFD